MDVKEVAARKEKAEGQIADILRSFVEDTGCQIDNLWLTSTNVTEIGDANIRKLHSVTIRSHI